MTRQQRLALLTTQHNDRQVQVARRRRRERQRVFGVPKGMRGRR